MRYSTEDLNRLLLKAEQGVHRRGWDQRPILASVVEIRPGSLTLAPWPVTPLNPVEQYIAYLADRFAAGDTEAKETTAALLMEHSGFYGVALINEVWGNSVMSPDQQRQWLADGKGLADHPESYEARVIQVVDVYGGTCILFRRRGEKPILGDLGMIGGRLVQALYKLTRAVAAALPDDRCDREALAKLTFMTPAEVQQQWETIHGREM